MAGVVRGCPGLSLCCHLANWDFFLAKQSEGVGLPTWHLVSLRAGLLSLGTRNILGHSVVGGCLHYVGCLGTFLPLVRQMLVATPLPSADV